MFAPLRSPPHLAESQEGLLAQRLDLVVVQVQVVQVLQAPVFAQINKFKSIP